MIAPEVRWPVLALAALAAAGVYLLPNPWWVPGLVLAALLLAVFREPRCRVPPAPLGVVSSVNGRVIGVENRSDPWLEREAVVVRLRQGWLGPLAIRFPIEGKLVDSWYPAAPPAAEELRVELALHIRTDENDDVVAAFCARSLGVSYYHAQPGERVGQGQRGGLIGFNRQAAVFVPANSVIKVKSGDRVRAGETILANLVHAE